MFQHVHYKNHKADGKTSNLFGKNTNHIELKFQCLVKNFSTVMYLHFFNSVFKSTIFVKKGSSRKWTVYGQNGRSLLTDRLVSFKPFYSSVLWSNDRPRSCDHLLSSLQTVYFEPDSKIALCQKPV